MLNIFFLIIKINILVILLVIVNKNNGYIKNEIQSMFDIEWVKFNYKYKNDLSNIHFIFIK